MGGGERLGKVIIQEQYLNDIADSIRKMQGSKKTMKPYQMADEIKKCDIVWDPDERWVRPSDWPDYSQIDISDFEGMYFTYDTSQADNRTQFVSIMCYCSGGYTVERGQIINGAFVSEYSTDVANQSYYREWIQSTESGYVVYRVTPKTSGAAITRMYMGNLEAFMTGDGRFINYRLQPLLERYGRLPNVGYLYNWANRSVVSDTILDLKSLSSLSSIWQGAFSIQNIDITGYDSQATSCYATFADCSNLKFLNNTDKFVTSNCTNMQIMFNSCRNICFIDSSTWDTSNVTNMSSAFSGCYNLYKLDVSNFVTSKVTNMGGMFQNCFKLRKLDVSGFDTSLCTNFSSMFQYYQGDELDVSGFSTALATNMASMFQYCAFVKTLDVTGFNTSNNTTLQAIFCGCYSLENLDVSGFDTSKVTNISSVFQYCYRLKELDISSWDLSKCTNMASAFYQTFKIDADFLFDFTKPMGTLTNINSLFYGNEGITHVDLSGLNLSSISTPDYLFRYCYRLETVIMPSTFKAFGAACFQECAQLTALVLPSTTLVTLGNSNNFNSRSGCVCKVYVPDNLISSYQNATNWKNTTDISFEPLSDWEALQAQNNS